jgi:hypothetical protein
MMLTSREGEVDRGVIVKQLEESNGVTVRQRAAAGTPTEYHDWNYLKQTMTSMGNGILQSQIVRSEIKWALAATSKKLRSQNANHAASIWSYDTAAGEYLHLLEGCNQVEQKGRDKRLDCHK